MTGITPCLLYNGQAEDAARFYIAALGDGAIDHISRYPDAAHFPAGTAIMVEFTLLGRSYLALNAGAGFAFTPAMSLSVSCADQAELDRYFDALTADGGAPGPCGWITDKYGLSWQLVPAEVEALYRTGDAGGIARMMAVMMTMQKLDLATMKAAFFGTTP